MKIENIGKKTQKLELLTVQAVLTVEFIMNILLCYYYVTA